MAYSMEKLGISQITELLKRRMGDPHSVLGMHEIQGKNKHVLVVRQVMPGAKKIRVIEKNGGKSYELDKIHEDGYFERVIPRRVKYFEYYLEVDFGDSLWTTEDQYSFEPTISEYDRFLFNAGNHYQIYKKLGAHQKELNGVSGVSFGVWAPNAKSVSVVGSFNEWDGRRNMMRLLGDSGIWELFIPGLCQGDIYKYSVLEQSGKETLKTDPYGNYSQLRPDTASVIYDIDNYKWHDKKWIRARETGDPYNGPMNIYEVHLGSWMRVPEEDNRFLTYTELSEKLLAYVKEMHYTHIEIMPVTEYPFDGSWGYQVTGYYAPTSRYGTPLEFKSFVDRFHQNGIGVIMDWVPAHFPKDAHGLARFDGTALYEHEDWKRGEHIQWGTYIFNYGRNEVKNFLIANALFWINEYHIDGLRVDAVASMLYLDYCREDGQWLPNEYGGRENIEAVEFIKHMNSIISKKNKGVLMIAEESTSWEGVTLNADNGGLGFGMKWNMGWMNDFLSYLKKATVHRKFHHTNITFSMMYAFSENYVLVLSHDEVVHMKGAMMYKAPGDMWQKAANLRTAYGFMYAHPGKKLMFMGNEIGQFSEWSEARSLDWHVLEYPIHKQLHDYVKALNQFYLDEGAMWSQDFTFEGFRWIECDDNERSVIAFTRYAKEGKDEISFVCNFTEQVYDGFVLGVPREENYIEVFNSDRKEFGGTGRKNKGLLKNLNSPANRCNHSIQITLPPLSFLAFKPVTKK